MVVEKKVISIRGDEATLEAFLRYKKENGLNELRFSDCILVQVPPKKKVPKFKRKL